ncbi:MAG: histone deacetylase [Chloroflexi bacterium]|nr:histone deacetylase [Chloroflexota bacterium]
MTAIYTDPHCLEHSSPGHPERPERLVAAVEAVRDAGLDLSWPEVRPADTRTMELTHSRQHVSQVENLARAGGGWIDLDTFVTGASYEAAAYAVGATVQAVSDVVRGVHPNGLVLVRPPGHHATRERSMGFCLFNNIALAAEWALTELSIARAAIVDIDVHHGNGTQEIFYDRANVLYCSVHQYPYYPGTGGISETGEDGGIGATVNLPLMAGCGDDSYLAVTEQVLVPALRRFRPGCLLVSLGFDAHWADPLAGMRLSVRGYSQILEQFLAAADELCDGRAILLLEGGYDLNVLRTGVSSAAALLAGQPVPRDALGPAMGGSEPVGVTEVIAAARAVHGL